MNNRTAKKDLWVPAFLSMFLVSLYGIVRLLTEHLNKYKGLILLIITAIMFLLYFSAFPLPIKFLYSVKQDILSFFECIIAVKTIWRLFGLLNF